ncbi:hypothetical protein Zmor_000638 [Zophobas morio]|uniref:Nucleic-acid-binding protein from transposon X-element n=1 Tax=Zophobas morio TaxID=2755281 RepID=A0AA38IZM1_9CUCU|nr:hypothetical protein Zmor_000638 [Zophobas morio]
MDTETVTTKPKKSTPALPKQKPPPVIILHGQLEDHKAFQKLLTDTAKGGYTLKYTKRRTTIQVANKRDWETLCRQLEMREISHHTYTCVEDKTHGFVLKGLDFEPEIEDLKDELREENIPCEKLFKMRGTKRPAYLIITTKDVTLSQLQRHKYVILNTRVTWERHYNNRKITQCHTCQEWGHATLNCKSKPKCLKCAGPHRVADCDPDLVNLKCANCDGNHAANNPDCPTYVRKIQEIKKSEEPQKKFVEAPPPKSNPWRKLPATPANTATTGTSNATIAHTRPQQGYPQQRSPTKCSAPNSVSAATRECANLFSALTELKAACNISEMVRAINDLNALLKEASTKAEKFLVFTQFTEQLDSYDI